MLLFQKRFHEGLVSGAIELTFRRWERSRVRAGGRYRCHPIGVLEVDSVDRVTVGSITQEQSKLAGFSDRDELVAYLDSAPDGPTTDATPVFSIALRHVGDGDRVPLALEARLDAEAIAAIARSLDALDDKARASNARDTRTAWTRSTLALIAERPREAASALAASLGRVTATFKADVVQLKRLGLTQSFEVGYALSPRGVAFLEANAATSGKRRRARSSGT